MKKILSGLLSAAMVVSMTSIPAMAGDNGQVTGTQKAYIIGDDWGPAVTKTVITLDKSVDADSLDKNDFTVMEKKETMSGVGEPSKRTVVDVYPSDAKGNKTEGDSSTIAIEMSVDPSTGSPFIYRGFNYWCSTYELDVTLNEGSEVLLADGTAVESFDIDPVIDLKGGDKIVPQVDGVFDIDQKYTAEDGTVYNYADYKPADDSKDNALVIWLHGAGEGSANGVNDSYIDLLGNEVTALAGDEFQDLFGGAYVLVPQADTMWMDGGDGGYQSGDKGSRYADSLFEFIDSYVEKNPDIDADRIIIGGCSNGGYMTMEMIIKHPDYFAAAFPICEAFQDKYITDEQIESLVDMPIWFTYAKNDPSVDPTACAEPTIERLLAAGAKNVHVSEFDDVHDTTGRFTNADGTPYTYNGHWSWTYFDNNECFDENGVNAWKWLSEQTNAVAAAGTQKAYIIGDDWGPAVTKTVVTLDKAIDADSLKKADFSVTETKEGMFGVGQPAAREVVDVYPCDAEGNRTEGDSKTIAIEMSVDPNTGSPFVYKFTKGFNYWCETYELNISLNSGSSLKYADGTAVDKLNVDPVIDLKGDGKIVPQVDGVFDIDQKYTAEDGTVYNYADYKPAEDDKENALVIWLHGAGEGSDNGVNDSYIDLLGNEVTALASDEFQDLFGGAYLLVPQADTMWMDGGDGGYQNGDKGSRYADSLFELIESYVEENPDIDADRIIIGGCSNGGYMTMEMIIKHPDYFAAAFPICEAFQDQYITDEQIESLVDMPIWFTYAKTDTTVNPTLCAEPTIERLLAAGAENVHVSAFDDVHDTTGRFFNADGTPYTYNGHWSWTYFDNNECFDENGVNAWKWLSEQTNAITASGTQKAYIIGDDWGPAVTKTVVTLDKAIDADSLNKADFSVAETKEGMFGVGEPTAREVVDVYPCDAEGNRTEGDSKTIAIEMSVDPNTGSPFVYKFTQGFNYWCETYELNISLNSGSSLKYADGTAIDKLSVDPVIDLKGDGKIVPQVDGVFDIDQKYTAEDGTVYNYADYKPAEDDKENALVIWLHGAGEGSDNGVNDSYIDLLGNEVTALASDEFQDLFGGAYLLVPQADTMWMDGGDGGYQNGDKGSRYADSLFEFIESYVKENPDIDADRIIIGGCSNGGYMTMEMIIKHPDYFAAAFPICEAFQDQYITDEQIESLVDMPIWFTYAKTDTTVDPTLCAEPTIERLLAAGAENVHVSAFDDVHDTTGRFFNADGTPYTYNGHWSWTYFDNNECFDENGVNAWEWLAKQTNAEQTVQPGTDEKPGTDETPDKTPGTDETPDKTPAAGTDTTKKPVISTSGSSSNSPKTGDEFSGMATVLVLMISAGVIVAVRKRQSRSL